MGDRIADEHELGVHDMLPMARMPRTALRSSTRRICVCNGSEPGCGATSTATCDPVRAEHVRVRLVANHDGPVTGNARAAHART